MDRPKRAAHIRAIAMKDTAQGAGICGPFFLQNADGVGFGIARVDDERQTRLHRSADMFAKDAGLGFARGVIIKIIEAGLAYSDNFRVGGEGDQLGGGDVFAFLFRLVRMDAGSCNRHRRIFRRPLSPYRRQSGLSDGEKTPHARCTAREDTIKIVGEFAELQMAVTINKHRLLSLRLLHKAGEDA